MSIIMSNDLHYHAFWPFGTKFTYASMWCFKNHPVIMKFV